MTGYPQKSGLFQRVQTLTVDPVYAGQRLDNFLIRFFGKSKVPTSHIYRIIRKGEVRVNKKRAKAATRLEGGDLVRIPPFFEKPQSREISLYKNLPIDANILYENEDFIVFNKPNGVAVHGGSGQKASLIATLQAHFQNPYLSLVHRLDKETSGCLVLAKHYGAAKNAQSAFLAGHIEKKYVALLHGHFEGRETITAPLARNKLESGERMVQVSQEGQHAVSHFTALAKGENVTLVEVTIETGRTHQIRVHANCMGHPVVGDGKYGDRQKDKCWQKAAGGVGLHLHAAHITFPSGPTRADVITVIAPSPAWAKYG